MSWQYALFRFILNICQIYVKLLCCNLEIYNIFSRHACLSERSRSSPSVGTAASPNCGVITQISSYVHKRPPLSHTATKSSATEVPLVVISTLQQMISSFLPIILCTPLVLPPAQIPCYLTLCSVPSSPNSAPCAQQQQQQQQHCLCNHIMMATLLCGQRVR